MFTLVGVMTAWVRTQSDDHELPAREEKAEGFIFDSEAAT
jgi:hypothetical protein